MFSADGTFGNSVGGLLFFEGDAAHRILLILPTEFPNVHLREELASCERFNSHTLNAVPAPHETTHTRITDVCNSFCLSCYATRKPFTPYPARHHGWESLQVATNTQPVVWAWW